MDGERPLRDGKHQYRSNEDHCGRAHLCEHAQRGGRGGGGGGILLTPVDAASPLLKSLNSTSSALPFPLSALLPFTFLLSNFPTLLVSSLSISLSAALSSLLSALALKYSTSCLPAALNDSGFSCSPIPPPVATSPFHLLTAFSPTSATPRTTRTRVVPVMR